VIKDMPGEWGVQEAPPVIAELAVRADERSRVSKIISADERRRVLRLVQQYMKPSRSMMLLLRRKLASEDRHA